MTTSFPCLPVISLSTAQESTTHEIVRGAKTIIDFWTTRCVKCPQALDHLNELAAHPTNEHVRFVSICCDKLDGAREIIERDEQLKWTNVEHYFMEACEKEEAKRILGFKAVPFYVILNEQGEIEQMGNKVDMSFLEPPVVIEPEPEMEKTEARLGTDSPTDSRMFVLDDLDF